MLKYPCMFCSFCTLSRSNSERHMEMRHNEIFKRSLNLVRAHADALEVQHHQMLLALHIRNRLKKKLESEDMPQTPNHIPALDREENLEILCSSCGHVFRTYDYQHHCCEEADVKLQPKRTEKFPNMVTHTLNDGNCIRVPFAKNQDSLESATSLNLSKISKEMQIFGSSSNKTYFFHSQIEDPTENANVMTLLNMKTLWTESRHEFDEVVIFTFQDLLVLEQNLALV